MSRKIAQELAKQFINDNRPLAWFEELYKQANFKTDIIPWADLSPNINLCEWVKSKPKSFFVNKKILKIGCGLGDDSEYWAKFSPDVEAFDISSTAILWCKKRFPNSIVKYFEADITALSSEYFEKYDIVQESYTLQVLPPKQRGKALNIIPKLLKKNGRLIIICRGRDETDFEGNMPFPLTKSEFAALSQKLELVKFEDYFDNENPPVRRFRIEYKKG